jgi:hypothetical protein
MRRYFTAGLLIFNFLASYASISSFPRIASDTLSLIIEKSAEGHKIDFGTYTINPYLFSGFIALIITSVMAIAHAIYIAGMQKKPTESETMPAKIASERRAELETLRKTLYTLGVQSNLISSPFLNSTHQLKEARYRYHILDNYDGDMSITLAIEALQDLMFWELEFFADENANPLSSYKDLHPSAKLLNTNVPRDVFFMPIKEQPRRINMFAAFAPMLREGDMVELKVEARWPGFFNTLKKNRSDNVYWPAHTNKRSETVRTNLRISTDRNIPKIICKNSGHLAQGEKLKYDNQENSWTYSANTNFSDKGVNYFDIKIELAK